jgi:hypothetical protein
MYGTNYGVGFGIGLFFLVGGIGMYLLGESSTIDAAASTFKLIGIIWAGVALVLLLVFGLLRGRAASRHKLAETGLPGTATVKEAQQTGVYVNYNPQMKLSVDLEGDGFLPRTTETRVVVPMTVLGRFGIGTKLPVRVDPEKNERFEILWDELPPPLAQTAPGGVTAGGGATAEQRFAALDRLRDEGKITSAEYQRKRQDILNSI